MLETGRLKVKRNVWRKKLLTRLNHVIDNLRTTIVRLVRGFRSQLFVGKGTVADYRFWFFCRCIDFSQSAFYSSFSGHHLEVNCNWFRELSKANFFVYRDLFYFSPLSLSLSVYVYLSQIRFHTHSLFLTIGWAKKTVTARPPLSPQGYSEYNTKLHQVVKPQFWTYGECEVPLNCYYFRIQIFLEW